jgi:signal transduction histidine kinase
VDITAQVDLQAQLLQSQKMETVGRLAGGIAHDFNNLLTVINGTAELVLDQLKSPDPVRADIEQIRDAGDRAAALTRQLLAFSRKQVLTPAPLDLRVLVRRMEDMLRRLVSVEISLRVVTGDDPMVVSADAGQIEQVLMNLVVNARDAMPDGGTLTIGIEPARITEPSPDTPGCPPGEYVAVTVTDTGCGMDEATRARIFEPFFTTKESGHGTGLGLSTVYGIATQSGGAITVTSAPDAGSRFTLLLPRVAGV